MFYIRIELSLPGPLLMGMVVDCLTCEFHFVLLGVDAKKNHLLQSETYSGGRPLTENFLLSENLVTCCL